MTALAVDYSFQHPNPAAIVHAGYRGVLRYLTGGNGKAVTRSEVAQLHRAGLWVGLIWETTANRATQGNSAGVSDRKAAERAAKALGCPAGVVIFFTVDGDYQPRHVQPYFRGILSVKGSYVPGVYGSLSIVEAMPRWYSWQTEAWSGTQVSQHANLYQRVHATVAHPVAGTDENVVLKAFPVWASVTPAAKPAVPPAQQPTPAPGNPDHDLVAAFDRWRSAKSL